MLAGVGRGTAQTLMKAISEVASTGRAQFGERPALLTFLDQMVAAESAAEAKPVPRPKALRVALPHNVRHECALERGRWNSVPETVIEMLE